MWAKQIFSSLLLLLSLLATELVNNVVMSNCDESSHSRQGYQSGITSVGFTAISDEGSSDDGASSSGESSSSVTFPIATPASEPASAKQPAFTTQASTEALTSAPSTTTPITTEHAIRIEFDSASTSQSDESSASTSNTKQSTTRTSAPVVVASTSSDSSNSDSSSTTTSSNEADHSADTSNSDAEEDDVEASIAQPGSDSSTFQSVASAECSEEEVDNVYTLYSNCRSAFDLCVSASDYQIFPFQGEHPTQAQIQNMAESDACVAVFIVVIEANFSACTIGGMPLVSAVETLLKISVDLEQGLEDEAPSAEEFQELLIWRYQVDLAKSAGVPYDGSSELYAEFETNLDAALENTTIRMNKDLSVDVRLFNGTYETFDDAFDLIVTDASAADLAPSYVIASSIAGSSSSSSGSSSSTTGITIESSVAVAGRIPTLWSLVVVLVASIALLVERRV